MTSTESSGDTGRDRLCKAETKAGHPCRFPAMLDSSGYCWTHNPATATERQAAARRGGLRTAQKRSALLGQIDFGSAEGVRSFLEGLTSAAITDTIPSSKARDVAAIAEVALRVRQGPELEARVEDVEDSLKELQKMVSLLTRGEA